MDDMTLESYKGGQNGPCAVLDFCSVFALNRRQTKIWVCCNNGPKPNGDGERNGKKRAGNVILYTYEASEDETKKAGEWKKHEELPENKFPLLMLELSQDEVTNYD